MSLSVSSSPLQFLLFLSAYFPRPLSFPILLFPSLPHTLPHILLQTVLGVETRSSRVSLSWRWRNSGTSVASGVGPATWPSQESTSASECVKKETNKNTEKHNISQRFSLMFHSEKTKNTHAQFFISSFSPDRPNCASDTLKQFYSLCCRDGVPYCEADYHAQYGVKCETCSRYISGRVLEVRTKPDFSVRRC